MKNNIDISKHLNLIMNHNYDGYIAIFTGNDQLSIKNGQVVLVKNEKAPKIEDVGIKSHEWHKNHRTVEYPWSQEQIEENLSKGNLIKTYCCCVGVPTKYLQKIETGIA